ARQDIPTKRSRHLRARSKTAFQCSRACDRAPFGVWRSPTLTNVSEVDPQGQLDQPRLILLAGTTSRDDAKRGGSHYRARIGKSDAVCEVEGFRTELNPVTLTNDEIADHRNIEVNDTLPAKLGIVSRLVTKTERRWRREAVGVEPRAAVEPFHGR